ncbi:hypothetical protein ACHAWO_006820 [Cyclotella atomus]|uniref:Aspartyl/asparaginy/proline hydroxylase domain-containing protein n=1 Tax=Cyclotella atomus TaxID=382360 RepID=A0ABD3PA77_9STRA
MAKPVIATTALLYRCIASCDAYTQALSRLSHNSVRLHMSAIDIDRSVSILPETKPLSSRTFAGQVEQALLQRFSPDKIRRVLESWRLLDMDYEHKAFVGDQQIPAITDADSSRCYQHAPSYVPGLKAVAWWDNPTKTYSWAKSLSKSYKDIKDEFLSVMSSPDKLQEGNNIWAGALTTDAASYGEGWKTLVLLNRGQWDESNAKLFPVTSRAIYESGVPAAEAFFASMKPHSDIKPHSDFTNFVLTSHLPLVIPENGNNQCRLSVGDETRQWIEGELMMFDTSIYHDAINESDEMRYILMLRVWHPDLTIDEKNALQFIYDCLEVPDLLSEDPQVVLAAEQHANMMREFPLKKETGGGFGSATKGKGKGKKKNKK